MQRQYEDFLLYKIIEVVFCIDHYSNVLYSLYLKYVVMSIRFEIHLHIFGNTVSFVSRVVCTFSLYLEVVETSESRVFTCFAFSVLSCLWIYFGTCVLRLLSSVLLLMEESIQNSKRSVTDDGM